MWWHGWLFMCLFLRRHASLFFTDSQVWPHPFSQETVNSRFEPYQQNCIQNISLWRTLHYSLRLGDCKNCIWMVFHWWFILPLRTQRVTQPRKIAFSHPREFLGKRFALLHNILRWYWSRLVPRSEPLKFPHELWRTRQTANYQYIVFSAARLSFLTIEIVTLFLLHVYTFYFSSVLFSLGFCWASLLSSEIS